MENKIVFSATGAEWQIKELGDIFGDRECFNDELERIGYDSDVYYLQISIIAIPK